MKSISFTSFATQNSVSNRKVASFTGKERDEARTIAGVLCVGLYYYGARYMDPKTSRWLSADPALGEYIPMAPVNDEVKKHNQNLPDMGGIFNTVNMHLYHYAGNNPVKYTDPDGEQTATTHPGVIALNNYMTNVQTYNKAIEDTTSQIYDKLSTNNTLSKFIDKICSGGKYAQRAEAFEVKTLIAFSTIKIDLKNDLTNRGIIKADNKEKYTKEDAALFAVVVNATMLLNYLEQSELGPYAGDVEVPQMSVDDAHEFLNNTAKYDSILKKLDEISE